MNKASIIEALVEHFTNGNKSKFATMIGVTPQTINTWITRNTFDIELLFAKCENISAEWLLTGEGSMLKTDIPTESSDAPPLNTENAALNTLKGIIKEQALEIARLELEVENLKKRINNG